jgi:dethiobiotin synthetase
MTPARLVVAGIGTEVGKTVVSAVLCEALRADYWKPVASGSEDGPVDHEIISTLIERPEHRIHPSSYIFAKSLSPHAAARMEGAEVELQKVQIPSTENALIIELAGGLAVPLNDTHTNLDLLVRWRFPVVVVSRHYLGSINHTLLTIEALRRRDVLIAGLVFNGEELPDTERVIQRFSGCPVIGRIPWQTQITRHDISTLAAGGAIDMS